MDIDTEKISVQLNKMKIKMNTKNLLVSFCAIAIALFLVATVSAATSELATISSVEVDGMDVSGSGDIGVVAGETISVKIAFTALENASNVKIEAEIEGEKVSVDETIGPFDVEEGKRYVRTLNVRLPYELKDQVSDDVILNIKLWNGDLRTEYPEVILRIQRDSYNAGIMSISAEQSVEAGEIFPVDVVLKNTGYNDLDDLDVTLRIPELGIEKTSYFGDIVAVEDDDNEDYVRGRFYVSVPYNTQSGTYTIEVEATNDDLSVTKSRQIIVGNDFPSNVIVTSGTNKIVSTGEESQYSLLLVNPTNKLKVYRIVTEPACETNCNLLVSANSAVVAVPAGLSKSVTINAVAQKEGEYTFNVNVFSGEELEQVVSFGLTAEGKATSPIAVLTIVLAIIFVVLLVVLIVLLGKKPQKTEELGESYY